MKTKNITVSTNVENSSTVRICLASHTRGQKSAALTSLYQSKTETLYIWQDKDTYTPGTNTIYEQGVHLTNRHTNDRTDSDTKIQYNAGCNQHVHALNIVTINSCGKKKKTKTDIAWPGHPDCHNQNEPGQSPREPNKYSRLPVSSVYCRTNVCRYG